MLNNFALLFVLLLLPCVVQAVDVDSLSSAERQALKLALERAEKPVEVRVREEAEQWAVLGTNVGRAMIGAAKELGMAASEFSQTPLGTVVVAILVVKIIGGTVLHLTAGVLLAVLAVGFFWYVHRRVLNRPVYEYRPVLWGLWNRAHLVKYVANEEDKHNIEGWNIVSVLFPAILLVASIAFLATAV